MSDLSHNQMKNTLQVDERNKQICNVKAVKTIKLLYINVRINL